MNWLNLNANSKQWVIKIVNDDFLVGVLDRKNKKFDPICRCEFYDQADLIRAALEHYIYAKNYASKGVGGCLKATAQYLRQTPMTDLPG